MSSTFRRVLLGVVSAATVAALTTPGAAMAKGPGGGGGGGGEETTSNSLSVPAVFVAGGVATGLTCNGTYMVMPESSTADPLTGYSIDSTAYYFVQGVHRWQAQCIEAGSATATAEWGDNLAGDAKLKVGSPIRVEVGLIATSANGLALPVMTGWNVVKLQSELLDRNSAYGTLATALIDEFGEPAGWASSPQDLTALTRVKDSAATLTITGTSVLDEAIVPEINATGRVVYGYNLRVTAPGEYEITFTFPNVTIKGADAGTFAEHTVTLPITVIGGGGGGGRPSR